MRRLIPKKAEDTGAVAIIVAFLFGTGVLLGCAALTIDVGNINLDRRQLQNGADAAALSAARDCVATVCPDPSLTASAAAQTNYARLVTLADSNAGPDGATKLARVDSGLAAGVPDPNAVCGTLPGLNPCIVGTVPGNLQECPASPLESLVPAVPYVRVYTQTLDKTRTKTLLPYSFGASIAGVGSGANQQACAAVAVGPAGLSPSLPFAFSACEWNNATSGGTVFHPGPPYDSVTNPMNPLWEKVIQFNSINGTDCSWNGHDFAGGFGWLCHDSGCTPPAASTCSITTSGGWVDANTGNGAGNDCRSGIEAAVGTVVYIPVFDCINPNKNFCPKPVGAEKSNGTHTWYHIQGYAAFFLTAVDNGSIQNHLSGYPTAASATACAGKGGKCLFGWFLKELTPVPGSIIDPNAYNFGLLVFQSVG